MENTEEYTVTARLKQFIEYSGLSNSQFADKAGIPRPTLSQLIHGRNKSVNDLLLRKLHESFPALNVSWLLFGIGNMTENSNIQFSEVQNSHNSCIKVHQNAVNQSNESLFSSDADISSESRKQILDPENTDIGVFSTIAANMVDSQSDNNTPKLPSPPPGKKIKSIIVLYTDSSFEVFAPDKSEL